MSTTPLNRMIGPEKGQIITRYWGYTRIVRQTISPAWHERTLVCCLKTYIMYQPMREPRRLAPTLGILALVCRLRTDLPRQTTLSNSPRSRFREKPPMPKSSIVYVNTIPRIVKRRSILKLTSYPPESVPSSRLNHSSSLPRCSGRFIVIFLTAYSKMIGLDSGGRSI